jgi:hypothetical protein
MGRWGTPEDFKGITLFFCSSASDYITGVRMPIDGGLHGRSPTSGNYRWSFPNVATLHSFVYTRVSLL